MTIAIVTHKFVQWEGQGRINTMVAHEALRRGHHLLLLSSHIEPELASMPAVEWVQISCERWPSQLVRDIVFARRSAHWLERHRGRYDVLKTNGGITWAPSDLNAVHFVHSAWQRSPMHTSRVHRGPYAWYHRLYSAVHARWERAAFEQARELVAVSSAVRGDLIEMGMAPEKIRVIQNGVDLDTFQPGAADRAVLGVPLEGVLGLFAGDIRSPLKNLETLLRALRNMPGVDLLVAGDAGESPYPALAQQMGLADRVHFLGFRSDLPDLMRAADFFALPSRYESFSLVLLEAMATGLPVITAQTVGAAELVTPNCGFVLEDPNDAEALAGAMGTLVYDEARRIQMGREARRVATQHSLSSTARQYVDALEALQRAQGEVTEVGASK